MRYFIKELKLYKRKWIKKGYYTQKFGSLSPHISLTLSFSNTHTSLFFLSLENSLYLLSNFFSKHHNHSHLTTKLCRFIRVFQATNKFKVKNIHLLKIHNNDLSYACAFYFKNRLLLLHLLQTCFLFVKMVFRTSWMCFNTMHVW